MRTELNFKIQNNYVNAELVCFTVNSWCKSQINRVVPQKCLMFLTLSGEIYGDMKRAGTLWSMRSAGFTTWGAFTNIYYWWIQNQAALVLNATYLQHIFHTVYLAMHYQLHMLCVTPSPYPKHTWVFSVWECILHMLQAATGFHSFRYSTRGGVF